MVITAGRFDLLGEAVCEDDDHLLEQAALRLGNPLTDSESTDRTPRGTARRASELASSPIRRRRAGRGLDEHAVSR